MLGLALLLTTLSTSTGQVDSAAARGWSDALRRDVKDGRVDYITLGDKDRPILDAYIAAVGAAQVPSDWNAAVGMYIDAYNALVIKSVIDHGRPRSVLDKKDFFTAPVHKVAGKQLSLDDLEKKVLAPLAHDPRLHMVLVCGAVSCPALESQPFAGSDIKARFDVATRRFLAGPSGAIAGDGYLFLSKIFDWYKADFGGEAGALELVRKNLSPDREKKLGAKPRVSYLEYNWTLNQK